MKILYYDCFSGISGDMNLAALIDLGVDKDYLIKELSKLNLDEFEVKVSLDNRKGITGTRVDVILHHEEHDHEGEGHHHHHHHHDHRNLKDIEKIIIGSNLNDKVKKISLDIFLKVAEAEGKIHGKPLDEVHFHEVGAVDSIVDIIGAAICLDYLKVDKVMCSPVEVGGGFVKCAHGLFPVPAPATTEILRGVPIKSGAVPFETTTPTGAAILRATVASFTDKKDFIISKVAYGIGHRDTEIPNVLRVFLGEIEESTSAKEEVIVIECNIDDMNPELYDYVMEKTLEEGAMDVYLTPIIMKKGRPAIKLTVLCSNRIEQKIEEILLRETTTLGVRKYKVERTILERKASKVATDYGDVRVKTSYYNGEPLKVKPEYDDCKAIAKENNIAINKVYEEVMKKTKE